MDALILEAAVIDADVVVEFGQASIHMLGPGFAPMLQKRRAVPVPRLGAEAIHADLPKGQHHMGMGLRQAVLADVAVDV
ncbi:hypothetical protein D3C85_1332260 [compost metagenome]